MKFRTLVALVASAVLPVLGFGQLINQTAAFNFGFGTSNPLPSSGSPAFVSLPQFDPTLGTLDSVVLSLNTSGTVYAEAFNSTGTTQNYLNSRATLNFGVVGPDGSAISINPMTALFSGVLASAPPIQTTGSTNFALAPSVTALSNLSAYLGTGNVQFTFNSDGQSGPISSQISALSGVFTSGDATVNGTLTVSYNYSPIPEPSTSAAVMGAFAMAALLFRRLNLRPAGPGLIG